MSVQERLAHAGRGQLVLTSTTLLASFTSQALIARNLGPRGLGEYSATTLFLAIVTVVTTFGLTTATTQRMAASSAGRSGDETAAGAALTLFLGGLGITLALAMIAWIPFTIIARIDNRAPMILVLLGCGLLVFQYYVVALLLARLRLTEITVIAVVQPLTVAVAAVLTGGVLGGSNLAILGSICTGVAALAYFALHPVRPSLERSEVAALVAGLSPGSAILYLTLVTSWIDRFVATMFLGPSGLGAYAAASHLATAVLRLPGGAGMFAISTYAHLANDGIGLRRVLDSHIRIGAAYAIVAGALLAATAPNALELAFGPAFRPATTALQLLAIALVPTITAVTLAQGGLGSGESLLPGGLLALLILLQAALDIAGTTFSVAGLAGAGLLTWMIVAWLYARVAFKVPRARVSGETLLRVAGVAAPLLVLGVIVGRSPLPLLAQVALVGPVSVIVAVAFLIRDAELRLLRRMLRPRNDGGIDATSG